MDHSESPPLKRPLTLEEKQKIYDVIYKNMACDDLYPCMVIAEKFYGDEEEYLRVMASWHGIKLSD